MSPSDPARPQAIIVALQKADDLEKAAVANTEAAGKVSSASKGTYDSKKLDEAEKGLKDAVAEESRELVWNLRQKIKNKQRGGLSHGWWREPIQRHSDIAKLS